ncbi:hypothetical protein BMR1_01G01872 [Babesia microti strain RI]|uniref:Uncharacterized protein n=1 Tax=Babesia microti (strain RI) TaxID=1133968 RepID=A0A1N6LWS3_BABMR|nr:hypothetical protein BMR1_01G01872 [Babesia microti strain RI]SIO73330.1 hypothetical protein BMR1_01G01872 [Babesia microti strain RI]|eukprot:XP_021337432.1 hypothetical protein BMR1_01G01872 [Babesia microti strain RI]
MKQYKIIFSLLLLTLILTCTGLFLTIYFSFRSRGDSILSANFEWIENDKTLLGSPNMLIKVNVLLDELSKSLNIINDREKYF